MTPLFLLFAFLGLVFCLAAIVSDAIELYANRNQARRRQHDPRYWHTRRGKGAGLGARGRSARPLIERGLP